MLALEALLNRYGTQVALAAALTMPDGSTVSQATVSAALRRQYLGVTFARAVATKLGLPFEDLIGGRVEAPAGGGRYKDLPRWEAESAKVLEQGLLPRFLVPIIGDAFVPFSLRPLDAAMIVQLGMYWMQFAPAEVRNAAEKAEIRAEWARQLAEEEARHDQSEDSGTVARDSYVSPTPAAATQTR